MRYRLLTLLLLTLLACDFSNEVSPTGDFHNEFSLSRDFEVTISGAGCGLPLIDFKGDDLADLESITGSGVGSRYCAFNLDKKLLQNGQVIIVEVRKTKDNEYWACTHLGLNYPWITVVGMKLKN